MPHLTLGLLGAFQAQLNYQPLCGFQSNKARALLAYLAVEARPHSRAQLAGLFWPEWPDATALTYLRHALANLRQILGDNGTPQPFLLVTRDILQFNPHSEHVIDVTELRANLARCAPAPRHPLDAATLHCLQTAAACYHSPLLAGFYLDGCAAFEEWLLMMRENLQRQVMDALRLLADHLEQTDDYEGAHPYAQRCVELEPWSEEAHRQLMRLLALNGHRSDALAQYETCRRLLAAELGVEPATETIALYEQIHANSLTKMTRWQDGKMRVTPASENPLAAPLQPLLKHNLPVPPTPLIGREAECTAIQTLLCSVGVRLVTITGPGGVGKTRLALQVAQTIMQNPKFIDSTFLVSLAPIREADLVIAAIAQTLGVQTMGNRPLLEVVKATLRARPILLVLDNFEHLAAAVGIVAELLSACPVLKVLVTSRERLHLQGEHEYSLPPLPVPDPVAPVDHAFFACASVELFRQRARAVRSDFNLNQVNASAIAAICVRLDGLPLAIELAATRIKLFTPQILLHWLTNANSHSPLRFLKADIHDTPGRHRSLWATVAWSYDLLDSEEQMLFRRLAVFVGGCTLEAATAACGDGLALDILDGLTSLVDKHLVRQVEEDRPEASSEPCFTLLETMREFGLEQLQQCQELALTQQRHTDYYVRLVVVLGPKLRSQQSVPTLAALRRAYPNILAAFHWALAQRQVEVCMQLCDSLNSFWTLGHLKEAEAYVEATLRLAEEAPPSAHYVNALATAGYNAYLRGNLQRARPYLERCLAMNQAIGNLGSPMKVCMANGILAWSKFDQGEYAAAQSYQAAEVKNAQDAGDGWALAMALTNMGEMATRLGDFERAAALLAEALVRHRAIGQKWGIALCLTNHGLLYMQQGEFAQAERALLESQTLCEEIQSRDMLTNRKIDFARLAMAQGDNARTAMLLRAALPVQSELGRQNAIIETLELIAQLALRLARPLCTLTLAGVASAQRRTLEIVLPPLEKQVLDRVVLMAYQQLDIETSTAAWAEGERMTLDEAVAYALANITAA